MTTVHLESGEIRFSPTGQGKVYSACGRHVPELHHRTLLWALVTCKTCRRKIDRIEEARQRLLKRKSLQRHIEETDDCD